MIGDRKTWDFVPGFGRDVSEAMEPVFEQMKALALLGIDHAVLIVNDGTGLNITLEWGDEVARSDWDNAPPAPATPQQDRRPRAKDGPQA